MKDKIIETALAGFLKNGIKSITIKKLVEPMGISTKTVYKYFAGKEALLESCLDVHYKALSADFESLTLKYNNPVETILGIFSSILATDFGVNHLFYHDLNYYYPELQNKVIERTNKVHTKRLEAIITAGIDGGYFDPKINPEIIVSGIGLLYTAITRSDHYKKLKLKPTVLFENLVTVYVKGICTEKGLTQIKNN